MKNVVSEKGAGEIADRDRVPELSYGQKQSFTAYLEEKIEAEKQLLSSEIHDELGQILTALKMELSWLTKRMPEGSGLLSERLSIALDLIEEGEHAVRRISQGLRPPLLDDLGLEAAIELMTRQFQTRTGVRVDVEWDNFTAGLEAGRSLAVFRIVQEALTNVARHAKATKVAVRSAVEADRLIVTISDNGQGIPRHKLAAPDACGLIGMSERAHRWGGDLRIEGRPGEGTTLTIDIPVRGG